MADFLCSEAIVRHVFKRVAPLRANPSTLELRLPVPVLQDPVAHSAHSAHGARAWRIWCAWRNRTPPCLHWAWRAWTRRHVCVDDASDDDTNPGAAGAARAPPPPLHSEANAACAPPPPHSEAKSEATAACALPPRQSEADAVNATHAPLPLHSEANAACAPPPPHSEAKSEATAACALPPRQSEADAVNATHAPLPLHSEANAACAAHAPALPQSEANRASPSAASSRDNGAPLTARGIRDLLTSAQGTSSLLYMWVLHELQVTVEPNDGTPPGAYVVVKVGRSEVTRDLTSRLVREIGETGAWRACTRSPLHERVACLLLGEGVAGHEKKLRAAAGFGVGSARVDREASAPELAAMLARDATVSMDALLAKSSGRLRVKDGWRLFLSATQHRCGIGPSELVIMRAAAVPALRAATAARGAALTLAEVQAVCAAHAVDFAGHRLRVRFPGEHGLVFRA